MRGASINLKAWLMAGVFALPGVVAHAQAAKPATPGVQAQAASGGNELEEVIVTAQRQSETAQRAAVGLSVISPEAMLRAGVTQPADLTSVAPAVQFTSASTTTYFYIRGVGTQTSNSYTDPTVAFGYDGVYIGRPAATQGYFYDLQRVEVLKGPQGTLYGRNATGGAINVIPAVPNFDGNHGYIRVEGGNYSTFNVEAAANLAVNDKLAARFSGFDQNHSAYLSSNDSRFHAYGGRLQLRYEPSSDFSLRVAVDGAHFGGSGIGGVITDYVTNADNAAFAAVATNPVLGTSASPHFTPTSYPRDTSDIDPRTTTSVYRQIYSGQAGRTLDGLGVTPFVNNDNWGITAVMDWRIGPGTLTFQPAYRETKLDMVDASPGFAAPENDNDDQKSVEVRYASPTQGWLRYIVGLYWYKDHVISGLAFNQQTLVAIQPIDTGTESTAEFARVTFAPQDSLRFTFGVRNTRDVKDFKANTTTILNICTVAACPNGPLFPLVKTEAEAVSKMGLVGPFAGFGPFNRIYVSPSAPGSIYGVIASSYNNSRTDSKVNWHAGVEYDIGPASLLYANFDTGFHGGGFSTVTDSRATFAPETITAYTIGSKNRFLDNRLQLNLEFFYWQYRNQQISHFTVDRVTGSQAFATENIGRSTNKGAEVDVTYLLTPDTLLGADVQYLDATYDSFKYDVVPPTATGCRYTTLVNPVDVGQVGVDCSGKQATRSPKWTVSLNAQQTFHLDNGMQVLLGGNTHWQSESMQFIDYLPEQMQPAYWRSNLYATLQFGKDNAYEVTAFVNNVEGDRQEVRTYVSTGWLVAQPNAPRTYGLRVRAEF